MKKNLLLLFSIFKRNKNLNLEAKFSKSEIDIAITRNLLEAKFSKSEIDIAITRNLLDFTYKISWKCKKCNHSGQNIFTQQLLDNGKFDFIKCIQKNHNNNCYRKNYKKQAFDWKGWTPPLVLVKSLSQGGN